MALACAVAAGCAQAPPPRVVPSRAAAIDTAAVLDPLVRSLVHRATVARSLRGRAEIEVAAEGWEGSAQTEAVVLAQRPDQLHLRAYAGPVTALDLVSHDGHFWAWVRDRHELWTGPVRALEHRMGIPSLGSALVRALLGDPFGPPEGARLLSIDADRAVVEWNAKDGGVARATIRRLDGVPLQMAWLRHGVTIATVRYDDYVHENEGLWPRQLSFHWNDPESSLRLAFHELQLNRDLPATSFAAPDPEGAKRVEFADPDSSARGQP